MAKGYSTLGDVLTKTADGRDLNEIWNEFQNVIGIHNERRNKIVDLLTYPVHNPIEDVVQANTDDFELASEFGVPKSIRTGANVFQMGFSFDWYDVATRFTWQYLSEASAAQVESVHASVLEADNRKLFNEVMKTAFNNKNREASIKNRNYTVYAMYNGDGTVPPPVGPNKFDGTYTHYLVSGADAIDSGDIEDIIDRFKKLGLGSNTGTQTVILANSREVNAIRRFRANVTNANNAVALYDFIPGPSAPAQLLTTPAGLLGTQPPSEFQGLPVAGSYGGAIIIEEDYIPAGYMFAFVTGGASAINNPIGLREHQNTELRGLKLMAGDRSADYPLINSNYIHGFGTGVRHRGNGIAMKIAAAGAYTPPEVYS